MTKHVYGGTVEDGISVLTTDGEPERCQVGSRFSWGPHGMIHQRMDTAIRILIRERVPITGLFAIAMRFEEEVVAKLPQDRPWQITSDEIQEWMKGGDK